MKKSKQNISSSKEIEKLKSLVKASSFFTGNNPLEKLAMGETISPEEQRQLLGIGNRKPISIRIPEDDLTEIKKIAKSNGRKYQQLIVQAVELYIDNYHRLKKTKSIL